MKAIIAMIVARLTCWRRGHRLTKITEPFINSDLLYCTRCKRHFMHHRREGWFVSVSQAEASELMLEGRILAAVCSNKPHDAIALQEELKAVKAARRRG